MASRKTARRPAARRRPARAATRRVSGKKASRSQAKRSKAPKKRAMPRRRPKVSKSSKPARRASSKRVARRKASRPAPKKRASKPSVRLKAKARTRAAAKPRAATPRAAAKPKTATKPKAAARPRTITTGKAVAKPKTAAVPTPVPLPFGGRPAPARRGLPSTLKTLRLPDGAGNDDRMISSARAGHDELRQRMEQHTETSPALTAGDIDARWGDAYAVGDEAPGGDNPTPGQDRVDDIGHALGIEYQDNEELKGADKVTDRDKHRWELDPASSEDYKERD